MTFGSVVPMSANVKAGNFTEEKFIILSAPINTDSYLYSCEFQTNQAGVVNLRVI